MPRSKPRGRKDAKVGGDAWRALVEQSKAPNKMYLAMKTYDDAARCPS